MPSALLPSLEQLSLSSSFTLPPELLLRVLAQLDNVLHLYNASLVSKAWRVAATDSRLWEEHYWRFYRPIYPSDEGHDAAIHRAWEQRRYAAIVRWLREASCLPSASPLSTPSFLDVMRSNLRQSSGSEVPDFHRVFVKQMNADEELLKDLRNQTSLTCNALRNLVKIATEHGPASRCLLAALRATQRLETSNIDCFLPPHNDDGGRQTPWPRAIEVHLTAEEGKTLPQRDHCVALLHAASMLLGHLQRHSAVLGIKSLQDRKHSFQRDGAESLRGTVTRCCLGLEEASESVAAFGAGSPCEIREYLDLLALSVFSQLEAEDRSGPSKDKASHQLQSYPPASTRHRMSRIVASLRALGFFAATGSDLEDVDNALLHVVLYCPAQRATLPLTLAIVVCAVARRLGIAASLCKATSRALLVVVEDGGQPPAWRAGEDGMVWDHFIVDVVDPKGLFTCETQQAGHLLKADGVPSSQHSALLEPASPLDFLGQVATNVKFSIRADRGPITRSRSTGRVYHARDDDATLKAKSTHSLGQLHLYLSGRQPYPSPPLLPAVLPSSLAMLPPTRVHAVRADPHRMGIEVTYCAHWILRITAPQRVGGIGRANGILGLIMSTPADGFACDYVLLAQLDCPSAKQDERSSLSTEAAARRCSEHVAELLDGDRQPGAGLGGAGHAQREPRQRFGCPILPPGLFDRGHPANSQVQFGVGAIVRHRVHGWHGVVIGWDSDWRGYEASMARHMMDDLPGDLCQPFYSVIEESSGQSYEAQCYLEAVCVPAGSTREEAKKLLESLLGLFNGVRSLGRAFRTLRVARWDARAGKKRQGGKKDPKEPLKGQVYLVMNAWMKEAWPYD